jgi:hypothetical protein
MSISGIGIIARIFMLIVGPILPTVILSVFRYLFLLWVVALSLWAIKDIQGISLSKAAFCYFVGALPFLFFGGKPVLAPYLAYL